MLDIGDSAVWDKALFRDNAPAHLTRELGYGPFKIVRRIGRKVEGYVNIEFSVPFKKRKKIGKTTSTAMVPSRLLKKV